MAWQTLHDYQRYSPSILMDAMTLERHRPLFAKPIATLITLRPHIEAAASAMLARVVGPSNFAMMAAHIALRSEGGQNAALAAAVKTHLSAEDFKLYRAIFKILREREKDRHNFSHWITAYAPQLPDLLLLVSPDHAAQWSAAIHSKPPPDGYLAVGMPFARIDHREVRVYNLKSAELAATKLEECCQYINRFGDIHHLRRLAEDDMSRRPPMPEPDQTRQWLLAQPRIQRALASL